ncbi:hypothetical protein Hanom_Chr00s000036g01617351 [Helianthus anomalus]
MACNFHICSHNLVDLIPKFSCFVEHLPPLHLHNLKSTKKIQNFKYPQKKSLNFYFFDLVVPDIEFDTVRDNRRMVK